MDIKQRKNKREKIVIPVELPVMLNFAEAYNKGKEDAVTEIIKQLENYIKTGNIDFISVSLGWVEKRLRKALKQSKISA